MQTSRETVHHGTYKVEQAGSADGEHPVGGEGLDLSTLLLEHVQLGQHRHRLNVQGERPRHVSDEEVVQVGVKNLGTKGGRREIYFGPQPPRVPSTTP